MGLYLETVADGVDALYAELALHKQYCQCAQQYAVQGTGYLVQYRYASYSHGGQDDNQQRTNGNEEVPWVERSDVLGVAYPFAYEVAGSLQGNGDGLSCLAHCLLCQSQHVAYLCGEDGYGNTCGETDDDGVGDELDDSPQLEQPQCNEYHACHHGGYEQALQSVCRVGDYSIDNHDECTRGATNLHLIASKGGNDETGNDGRDDALFGGNSAGYAKSDCQGQGHYADDDTGHKVLHETFLVVALQ